MSARSGRASTGADPGDTSGPGAQRPPAVASTGSHAVSFHARHQRPWRRPARPFTPLDHPTLELVIDVLKAAFVQGRLTRDELDARVGRAFTSRTYADLAALTADVHGRPYLD